MKINLGSTDKVIRFFLAALFAILYFTNVISGTLGIVLMVLAAIFAVTAFINFCPIYYVLGIRSNHTNNKVSL